MIKLIYRLKYLLLLAGFALVVSCASYHEESATPAPEPAHGSEGGIVGTGNQDDCQRSGNKTNCNEQRQ